MYYVLLHVITKHHRVLTPPLVYVRPVMFVVAGNIISFMTYLAPL